jgi:hypothetical protein
MPSTKLRYELLTVVHDENMADIELDVVLLLACIKHIKGGSLWHKQH